MSADTTPISPARFAAALKDLSEPMLRLKVLEVRNAIAHLQYSNDQLKPFAEGTATATSDASEGAAAEPDQDCIDAIRENKEVIERMVERIALVRLEVEERGASWAHFEEQARADEDGTRTRAEAAAEEEAEGGGGGGTAVNSNNSGGRSSNPWTDGTFQTGTIRNGEVHMDSHAGGGGGAVNGVTSTSSTTSEQGGRLSDAQLRAAMEERMRQLTTEEEEDDGLHL